MQRWCTGTSRQNFYWSNLTSKDYPLCIYTGLGPLDTRSKYHDTILSPGWTGTCLLHELNFFLGTYAGRSTLIQHVWHCWFQCSFFWKNWIFVSLARTEEFQRCAMIISANVKKFLPDHSCSIYCARWCFVYFRWFWREFFLATHPFFQMLRPKMLNNAGSFFIFGPTLIANHISFPFQMPFREPFILIYNKMTKNIDGKKRYDEMEETQKSLTFCLEWAHTIGSVRRKYWSTSTAPLALDLSTRIVLVIAEERSQIECVMFAKISHQNQCPKPIFLKIDSIK